MKLKNAWIKILALSLSLILLFSCAASAEIAVQAKSTSLLETFMENNTIPSLFAAAEKALQEGADPAKVRDALYTTADKKDMYPYFTYAIENYVAMGGKAYNRLMDVVGTDKGTSRKLNAGKSSKRSSVSSMRFDAYSTSQASSKFKSMNGDTGAQISIPPYFLSESDFKTLYKKSFSKFVPSRPRPGYVCVVVTDKSQSSPNTSWTKQDSDSFNNKVRNIVDSFFSKASDAGSPPVITGNPNVASDFLVIEYTYSLRGEYNLDNGRTIKGYNCKLSVHLEDAKNHKKLATYSQTKTLGDRISVTYWASYADAGVPDYKNNSSFTSLAKTAAKTFKSQDKAAAASRPLTESNAKAVLDGILQAQAKGANAWEAAIYESGAENITFKGSNEVTFALRNFNPNLKKLGAYADAKDPDEWLDSALQRIAKHNLTVTLKLSNGAPTKKSLNELKATVQKAAKSARSAYSSADMTTALKNRYFPSPVKKKVSASAELFRQTGRFTRFFEKYLSNHEFMTVDLFSAICYAQRSLTVNTKQGPHKLSLTFTGIAKPDKYVKSAADQVVNAMAYKPLKSRGADEDPETILVKRIAKNAVSTRANSKDKFSLTLDIDKLGSKNLPSSLRSYLNKFELREAASSMSYEIRTLPDIAAIEKPGTKILSGGNGRGGKVTISVAAKGNPTYIQFRKKGTKEKVVTMFIHPGKEITFRLPKGDYYFVYCTGTYWYGEKHRFMEPNNIFKSDSFDMRNNYIRTFKLNVSNGNSQVYRGSNSDMD